MLKVYGIPNCDTVKKAITWLKENKVNYHFHDYKKEGISTIKLKEWSKEVGWESLLNKKSTTWKQLDEQTKVAITDQEAAIQLMKEKVSIIKRPVIEREGAVLVVGFNEETYQKVFIKEDNYLTP